MSRFGDKLKIALITSALWVLTLSSCGGLSVKTWYADATNVKTECQGEKPLVRRNDKGDIEEALTILQANSYRCYSQEDDQAWRDRLNITAQCCNAKGSG